MKQKLLFAFRTSILALLALMLNGQENADIMAKIVQGERPKLAVTDFRGSGDSQSFMNTFNGTLWNDLQNTPTMQLVAKSVYPLEVPQQPSDFKPPTFTNPVRRGEQPQKVRNGPWLTDWSDPPVSANNLAFGYAAVSDGRLVLFGFLYNLSAATPQAAQLIAKTYFGSLDEAGARKVAHEFAADILTLFGGTSLNGSKIFFVSDRSGFKEIWSMDYDGSNQKQLTNYKAVSTSMPAVSADGKLLAYTTYAQGNPKIMVQTTDTGRRLAFYNPIASSVGTPEFSPDGKKIYFAATIDKWLQLCVADLDGGNMQRLSHVQAIEVSPKVNPQTGRDLLFISGRSSTQQMWRMGLDGSNLERMTSGVGEVANPAWHKNGQIIAFAWNGGYEPGAFNIFWMDVAEKKPVQLTHGDGINENPSWAPDGLHIVFSKRRGKVTQIYSMLADGTNLQLLTTSGNNIQPVWSKGIN